MIRSDHFWAGRLLICLWFSILLFTDAEGRQYDKCSTGDGREGVCVVKRLCREGFQHELLPCDRDHEHHCCPLPTTQRSAPTVPASVPEIPHEGYRPEPEVKRKNTDVFSEPDWDDQLNKTPPQGRRASVYFYDQPRKRPGAVEKTEDYDNERHNSYKYPENPGIIIERPKHNPQTRPVARPNEYDGRGPGIRQPESKPPSRQPGSDPAVRQPERYPVQQPTRGYAVPQQGTNRFYPPKDVFEPPRVTSPPRRNIYDNAPERRNHTTDDTSKFPITFPEPFNFPRPKVPACGVKPYDLFIAGGQESAEHEWPWMTAIFRRYPDSRPKTFLCGGSLINTKYVLTAAHCFVNNYVILPASSFVVRLGSHYLDSGDEYTVANLVIHKNHSGSDFFNDIALVRLASEVYITDKIAPICLPSPDMIRQSLVGRVATVAGWGDTAFRTSGTRILQHVSVPIVSGEECFAAYSRVRGAAFLARGSDHVICAGLREGGKDACLGDSGGPLMIRMPDDRWIIVGIVSLGYKCAEPGYPGVYTRVTHYMSWINTNMKRH